MIKMKQLTIIKSNYITTQENLSEFDVVYWCVKHFDSPLHRTIISLSLALPSTQTLSSYRCSNANIITLACTHEWSRFCVGHFVARLIVLCKDALRQ